MNPLSQEELAALLNVLLESERAGAKALGAYVDDRSLDERTRAELLRVQRDESRNCAVLLDLLERIDGEPSRATGSFLQKALSVDGLPARLDLLNRGQMWVAKRIDEALPRIDDAIVRVALEDMHTSHLANVEACNQLLPRS